MRDLAPLLDAEAGWLSREPEFSHGWERGCSWVENLVTERVYGYLSLLGVQDGPGELVAACQTAVCHAFLYYWGRAREDAGVRGGAVSGESVAETVSGGYRPVSPGAKPVPIGGNPFRDLVLVAAAVRGHSQSLDRFYREYRPVFDAESKRAPGLPPAVAEWEDLFTHLTLPRQPGDPATAPLAQFHGYGSLRAWLRPVAQNFLTDAWRSLRSRRAAEHRYAEQARYAPAGPAANLEPDERGALADFLVLLPRVVAALPPRDRRLVAWEAVGLPNRAVAADLGVSPGHASRLRHQALIALREGMVRLITDPREGSPGGAPWGEAFSRLSPDAVGALVRTLAPTLETEDAPTRATSDMSTIYTERDRTAPLKPFEPPTERSKVSERLPPGEEGGAEWPLPRWAFRAAGPGDAPEAIVAAALTLDPGQRPLVLCLDARGGSAAEQVQHWLERLDAVLYARHESDTDGGEPAAEVYEPRRVVLAAVGVRERLHPVWRDRGDTTWIPTDRVAAGADPFDVYTRFLVTVLNRGLQPLPPNPGPIPAGDSLGRVEDHLPDGQLEEWRSRMRDLGALAHGGDPGGTS